MLLLLARAQQSAPLDSEGLFCIKKRFALVDIKALVGRRTYFSVFTQNKFGQTCFPL